MSITIPVNINTTANRSIDIHRTSPFVESLSLKGGNPVPTDIKMEDLIIPFPVLLPPSFYKTTPNY